jgi:hypothetical protein
VVAVIGTSEQVLAQHPDGGKKNVKKAATKSAAASAQGRCKILSSAAFFKTK